jgi:hypothetical protein
MLIKYEALGFIHEGRINLTKPSDAEFNFLFALGFIKKKQK